MAQNNDSSAWSGWAYFAAFMMMFLGMMQGIAGLAGIFKNNYYLVAENRLLVFDYTVWGWINLVIGIVVFFAGLELLRTGAMWARVVAILLAGLSLVANITFIQAYPLWSIIMGIVDILVIYALTVHGNELKD